MISADYVVGRLRAGWTLTNRGRGWYLASPKIQYKTQELELVSDELMRSLSSDAVIGISLPYNTAIAELLEHK